MYYLLLCSEQCHKDCVHLQVESDPLFSRISSENSRIEFEIDHKTFMKVNYYYFNIYLQIPNSALSLSFECTGTCMFHIGPLCYTV